MNMGEGAGLTRHAPALASERAVDGRVLATGVIGLELAQIPDYDVSGRHATTIGDVNVSRTG